MSKYLISNVMSGQSYSNASLYVIHDNAFITSKTAMVTVFSERSLNILANLSTTCNITEVSNLPWLHRKMSAKF